MAATKKSQKLPTDIRAPSSEQEALLSPMDRNRNKKFGAYSYKSKYDQIIYNLLSTSTQAKSKSHCCNALQCSRPTLNKWIKKFPSFAKAFNEGMEIGKSKWLNKIATYSWRPSQNVNNGLIKLLTAHTYGIKEDVSIKVESERNQEGNPEKLLKQRGIPLPGVDMEDFEDE